MEIPNNPTGAILDTGKPTLTIDKLQTGQSLHIKIVDQLPNKTDVIIRIGNQVLQVKSDIPVSIGQTIKVTVDKTASELILKVKPPTQQTDITSASLRQLLPKQTPVNEFQQPLSQVFTSINKQAIKTVSSQSTELAPKLIQIKRLAIEILQSLPNHKNISTSAGLKSALQNSGHFLEPKLQQALPNNRNISNALINTNDPKAAANISLDPQLATKSTLNPKTTPPGNQHQVESTRIDVKANLVKLIQLLKAWPKATASSIQPTLNKQAQTRQATPHLPINTSTITPPTTQPAQPSSSRTLPPLQLLDNQIKELLTKTEGAISKITLNQLASSNTENNVGRQTWQIEVPFLNQNATESLFLKIEQEDSSSNESKEINPQWTVSLEMNPPKLGLIKNKLTLSNERINSSFWAEETDTRNLIHQHLNLFKEQLNNANLTPEKIQIQNGPGPKIQETKPVDSILREKA